MTKHRVPLNQLSASKINQWAEDGDEFEAASMSGAPGWGFSGRLDREWAALYSQHAREVSYTVYSYSTPIAWRTPTGWVVVTQTFSATTGARHQPHVRYIQPQRSDVWCPGGGKPVVKADGKASCPDCTLALGDRKRVVPSHLALKARVSA